MNYENFSGPIYSLHISMDEIESGKLVVRDFEPKTRGLLRQVPGKFNSAAEIPGLGEYIDLGQFTSSCLGNVSLCMYGVTVRFWVNFKDLFDNMYIMSSSRSGFTLMIENQDLHAYIQHGDRRWHTSVSDMRTGVWYFIEVTWNLISGLEVYFDHKLVAQVKRSEYNRYEDNPKYNNFYIGRANTVMYAEKYLAGVIDDLQVYNADRDRLLDIGFIIKGNRFDELLIFSISKCLWCATRLL